MEQNTKDLVNTILGGLHPVFVQTVVVITMPFSQAKITINGRDRFIVHPDGKVTDVSSGLEITLKRAAEYAKMVQDDWELLYPYMAYEYEWTHDDGVYSMDFANQRLRIILREDRPTQSEIPKFFWVTNPFGDAEYGGNTDTLEQAKEECLAALMKLLDNH